MKAIDRIGDYLDVRDDPARFAVWKARHPASPLTARDEMHLVIAEDESVRDLTSDLRRPGNV